MLRCTIYKPIWFIKSSQIFSCYKRRKKSLNWYDQQQYLYNFQVFKFKMIYPKIVVLHNYVYSEKFKRNVVRRIVQKYDLMRNVHINILTNKNMKKVSDPYTKQIEEFILNGENFVIFNPKVYKRKALYIFLNVEGKTSTTLYSTRNIPKEKLQISKTFHNSTVVKGLLS